MDIEEIINKINSKQATRKEIGESLGISASTLSRRLSDAGYAFDNRTKKYELASSKPAIQEEIKLEIKQTKIKESKPSSKEEIQERRIPKKVTYEIDENLHYELRMEAFRRKRNVSELVEAAIRQYLKG